MNARFMSKAFLAPAFGPVQAALIHPKTSTDRGEIMPALQFAPFASPGVMVRHRQ